MAGSPPPPTTHEARRMFLSSYRQELEKKGVLTPSKNCSPLWPPWSDVEYDAMEGDTAKYFLYYCAINAACSDFAKEKPDARMNILVLGPGRGRLVEYSIDCMKAKNVIGAVHVIESNIFCQQTLKEKYNNVTNVYIYPPMAIRDSGEVLSYVQSKHASDQIKLLLKDKIIDIIISELFGSFSDNEFMPEILSTSVELFGTKECFSIPAEYESFVMPIFSVKLQNYFDEFESNIGCIEDLFILGLPDDAVVLSEPKRVWKCSSCSAPPVNQNIIQFQLDVGSQFFALAESFKSVNSKLTDHNAESLPHENKTLFSCKENNDRPLHSSNTLLADLTEPGKENLKKKSCVVTGFAGHFTALLYNNIKIDTRPACTRNTYFWESAFFPINSTTRSQLDCKVVSFKMRRVLEKISVDKCDDDEVTVCCNPRNPIYRLYYEWTVISENEEVIGDIHNENGRCHSLYL